MVLKYRAPEKAIFGLMVAREKACFAPVWYTGVELLAAWTVMYPAALVICIA